VANNPPLNVAKHLLTLMGSLEVTSERRVGSLESLELEHSSKYL
jgi:hypothetical protein